MASLWAVNLRKRFFLGGALGVEVEVLKAVLMFPGNLVGDQPRAFRSADDSSLVLHTSWLSCCFYMHHHAPILRQLFQQQITEYFHDCNSLGGKISSFSFFSSTSQARFNHSGFQHFLYCNYCGLEMGILSCTVCCLGNPGNHGCCLLFSLHHVEPFCLRCY